MDGQYAVLERHGVGVSAQGLGNSLIPYAVQGREGPMAVHGFLENGVAGAVQGLPD